MQKLKETKAKNLKDEISGMLADKQTDQQDFTVTNRHMRLVLTAAQKSFPFSSHPTYVYLHEKHGIQMGHLCHTAQKAKEMAISIAKTMKESLIQQLKKEQGPISIILDGSTARRVDAVKKFIRFSKDCKISNLDFII